MPRFASWLGLSGLIIVLDQLTKSWVVSALRLGQSIEHHSPVARVQNLRAEKGAILVQNPVDSPVSPFLS